MFVMESKQNGVTFQSGNSPSDYRMSNVLFKLFWDFCNIWNSQISNETCCQVTDTDHFDVISHHRPTESKICHLKLLHEHFMLFRQLEWQAHTTTTWDHSLPPLGSGLRTVSLATQIWYFPFAILYTSNANYDFFSQFQFQQQTQSHFKFFEDPPPWTADSELCH